MMTRPGCVLPPQCQGEKPEGSLYLVEPSLVMLGPRPNQACSLKMKMPFLPKEVQKSNLRQYGQMKKQRREESEKRREEEGRSEKRKRQKLQHPIFETSATALCAALLVKQLYTLDVARRVFTSTVK